MLRGGVFLVPLLHVALGFSLRASAAISLATVIATSSTVSAGRTSERLINMRLAMLLEVATVAGSPREVRRGQTPLDRPHPGLTGEVPQSLRWASRNAFVCLRPDSIMNCRSASTRLNVVVPM